MSLTVLLIVFILALIGADQLVKYWAVHELLPVGTMKFIHFGNFRILDLTYLENDGAIFGSMSGQLVSYRVHGSCTDRRHGVSFC